MPLHGHKDRTSALAVGEVDGVPVAVTGDFEDGTLRVWDLRAGAASDAPVTPRRHPVTSVAVGDVDGTPVAISGGDDGTIRIRDLRTGAERGKPLRGHKGSVTALAVGKVDGTPVAVTSGWEGSVRVWDLRTGTGRGMLFPAGAFSRLLHRLGLSTRISGRSVLAIAVMEVDGVQVAVGGDAKGALRVWDLRTGAERGEPLHGHKRPVDAVTVGEVDGISVVVSGSKEDGTILLQDLGRGQRVWARVDIPGGIEAIASAGQAGWLTATTDGSLFTWRSTPA